MRDPRRRDSLVAMTLTESHHTSPNGMLPREPDVGSALSAAALVALHAPSVHNTQPWHLRVGPDVVELHADRRWELSTADPDGRMLVLSCGTALHHMRVALRAMGHLPTVRRFPDARRPDLLASVSVQRPIPVTEQAVTLMRATLARQTYRRQFSDAKVPEPTLTALRQAAGSEGAWLHLLTRDQVTTALAVAARSDEIEVADPGYRAELRAWINLPDDAPAGVPAAAGSPRDGDYSPHGVYTVLYGSGDRPISWLRAGEALSAVWLAATTHGLAVRPISSVVEVPAGRATLHHLLSGLGSPYLMMHLGLPEQARDLPLTPRRPAHESVAVMTAEDTAVGEETES